MGADLIGYLVDVPKKLPKTVYARALKQVMTVRRNDGSDELDDEPLPNKQAADKIVRRLMNEWFPYGRDCAYRQSPVGSDRLLVFCGDMSWGDTPDGHTYQYFEELDQRGLFTVFGIK